MMELVFADGERVKLPLDDDGYAFVLARRGETISIVDTGHTPLIDVLREIRDLTTSKSEPLDNASDHLQDALRRLSRIRSFVGLHLSSYEGECGQFPWKTAEEMPAPHLRCIKPANHENDHCAEDGLTWPQKDQQNVT